MHLCIFLCTRQGGRGACLGEVYVSRCLSEFPVDDFGVLVPFVCANPHLMISLVLMDRESASEI